MTRRALVLPLAILGFASLAACRKKVEPAPQPAAVPVTDNGEARRADSLAALAARRHADSLAAARAAGLAAESERARAEMAATLAQKVYFDYDKDQLRDDARVVLDGKSSILAANPAVTVVITGHTDERGTAEYNLALGQRRAAQVKRYLESKGIADARLTTQSLGDSQPAAPGTDEAAYQQNRRAEFQPHNAGALVRPRA